MNFTLLMQYIDVVFREMWQRKFLCLFGFALISYLVLIVGMFWASKFESSATIFADNQNILKPLLEKQAAQTEVQDQVKIISDLIHTPRILRKVIVGVYGEDSFGGQLELENKINQLRGGVKLQSLGAKSSYIKLTYKGATPEDAYRVMNEVIDVFITTSADKQRSESREAFHFIDNQVKQYKDQLVQAEELLKGFHATNVDGTNIGVDASISRLRVQIEELKINLDEDKTTILVLKKQLANEQEYSTSRFTADVYGERLATLETRKSTLLLNYTEDYPDVISVNAQIADIKRIIQDSESNIGRVDKSKDEEGSILNPLYQELRSRLSLVQAELKAKGKRLVALEGLKDQEFERRKRIAGRGAEQAELTRDYDVTKRIYEDMLERKEKARLSMTLNIEGQGVTYRVQEPANLPISPVGLRFLHFVLVGPFVGVLSIIGLAVLYILLDQRIRFADGLQNLGVTTLATIPHVKTPFTKRIVRADMILCLVIGIAILTAYVGLAYVSKIGLI
jgi:polysaccharide chain length determinant protein (PEP-CTERM system associated)